MKYFAVIIAFSAFCLTISGQEEQGFVLKNSKKLSLETQIKNSQKILKDLIKEKNATKDPNKKIKLLEEIKAVHLENQKNIRDYNKIIKELKYRHPEKGDDSKRTYLPLRDDNLKQVEKEIGLDAALSKAKKKVLKKYAPVVDKSKNKKISQKKVKNTDSKPLINKKKKKPLRLVK